MRPRALPLLIFAILFIATACDSFVEYTVVNQTDEELEAWVFFQDCSDEVGYRSDYGYRRTVPPNTTVEESDVTGTLPREPWCLQVVDSQRRLVRAEPMPEYYVTVVISEPLERGRVMPTEDELQTRSWLNGRRNDMKNAPGVVLVWLVGLVMLVALPYGIYRAVRDVRNRSQKRES